jgi:hypothetical protein
MLELAHKLTADYVNQTAAGEMDTSNMFTLGDRKKDQELKERLAEFMHKSWVSWMAHMFTNCNWENDGSVTVPDFVVRKWSKSMELLYEQLPESEKDVNKEEADQIIDILSYASPHCEDCGKEIGQRTGLEKNGVLTPLCSVCQGRRISKLSGSKEDV